MSSFHPRKSPLKICFNKSHETGEIKTIQRNAISRWCHTERACDEFLSRKKIFYGLHHQREIEMCMWLVYASDGRGVHGGLNDNMEEEKGSGVG
jgi:hypothetical protein